MIKEKLQEYFGKEIKEVITKIDEYFFENLEEIRIRANKCIILNIKGDEYFLEKNGDIKKDFNKEKIFIPTNKGIKQTIECMSEYSLYAFEEEIKNGFITLKGGFRVGLAGSAVIENNTIKALKNISSINIRIAKQVKDCCKKAIPYLKSGDEFFSTMIISKPNGGKTTFLRDLIKNISDLGNNICVIDERMEIAGVYNGVASMDLGLRTDILDKAPKQQGMINALRSMSPKFIAVDEVGTNEDIIAIEKIFNSGVKILATAHSENIEEFKDKYNFKNIIKNEYFKRYIVLKNISTKHVIEGIYNSKFEPIFKGDFI